MKKKFISTIVGFSVVLFSLVGAPAYGRDGGHGRGGHAGGFSGGARAGGVGRGYSGAGISRAGGNYGARSYSPVIATGHYGRYRGYGRRYYAPRSSTGGQIYGASARSQSYYVPRDQFATGFARKPGIQQRADTTAKGATRSGSAWSRQNVANRQKLDPKTTERLRNWRGKAPGWADAKRNHDQQWRDRHHHGHDWWHHHCDAIVLVGWGYWGWYDGWWYPAWGYDPYYSYYDYNSPIYGYDGLQPDEIIAEVQGALQQLGYYPYAVDGALGPLTEAAIANYQRDYGLSVTGAIDPSTVRSLRLGS